MSSLWRREQGNDKQKKLLDEWPIDMPKDYIDLINIQEDEKENQELDSLRYSVNKGKPYGSNDWTNRMISRFNLGSTLRGAGRPINRS